MQATSHALHARTQMTNHPVFYATTASPEMPGSVILYLSGTKLASRGYNIKHCGYSY